MQIIFTDQINRKLFFKEIIQKYGIYLLKREIHTSPIQKKALQDKHLVERCYLFMDLEFR